MPISALPALDRTSATFKTELDAYFLTALPTFSTEAEAARVEVLAKEVSATASAATAVAASEVALAGSNYKGEWASLTGALNKPASVSYGGTFWALATNVVSVAIEIPGTSSAWVAVIAGSIQQNSKSAAYTLVLADAGKHVLHPSADTTARIFTIPANATAAFPIGAAITFVNQASAGVITIAITSDVMRWSPTGTTGSRSLAANGIATAVKVTATEWIINGSGLT